MQTTKWYEKKFLGIPAGGIILGTLMLILLQCVFYNIGGWYARLPGQTIHILKWDALDDAIPLIPVFIVPYVYSYVFWLIGLIVPSKTDKDFYFDWMVGSMIALTIGLIIFFVYPTYMYRDQENLYALAGNSIFGKLIKSIYNADGVNLAACLFPSYHCLTSTICLLGVWGRKEVHKGFQIYTLIVAILIYLSTVFVKQHYVPDVFSGILLGLLGFWVARRFHLGRGLAAKWRGEKTKKKKA